MNPQAIGNPKMNSMKAAQLVGPRSVAVRYVPLPALPQDSDVLIRVGAAGICGSDLHYYVQGGIGDQIVEYPFTLGHECAGTVEMCGPLSGELAPGDRVTVDPAVSCEECDQCHAGRPHTCRSLKFLGCPGQLSGCMSEYLVLPARNCFKLPSDLSLIQGVLSEPLAIGIYAAAFLKDLDPETIGILGAGPIGLSVLLACTAQGLQKIYMTDKIETRVHAARAHGARWSGNPEKSDIVADILDQEKDLDAVFECSGDPQALEQAVRLLRPGGTLFILGIPERPKIFFAIHTLRRKEIRIQNIRRQNQCTQQALDLLADGAIDASFMVTHTFGMEKIGQALELAANYADGVIKAIVRLDIQDE